MLFPLTNIFEKLPQYHLSCLFSRKVVYSDHRTLHHDCAICHDLTTVSPWSFPHMSLGLRVFIPPSLRCITSYPLLNFSTSKSRTCCSPFVTQQYCHWHLCMLAGFSQPASLAQEWHAWVLDTVMLIFLYIGTVWVC